MPRLPSLPEGAHISDLFQRFPKSRAALMAFTDVVMREKGALDIGMREMIAAYVSGLNACTFCHGSHAIYAEAFGIDADALAAAIDDLETAPLPEKDKALLRYVGRLKDMPAKVTQAEMDAVLAAGWSEDALFEAIQITGLFNMMNRIIDGSGVTFDYDTDQSVHPAAKLGDRIREHSYSGTPFGKRPQQ